MINRIEECIKRIDEIVENYDTFDKEVIANRLRAIAKDMRSVLNGDIKSLQEVVVDAMNKAAQEMYERYVDTNPYMHSNRFAPWHELDEATQQAWKTKLITNSMSQ
jgi:hypothetical protein